MSRDAILGRVRAHQGDTLALFGVPSGAPAERAELITRFTTVLEQVGGVWAARTAPDDLAAIIATRYPQAEHLVSTVAEGPHGTLEVGWDTPATELARVELAILRGRLGVAENAAVWIDDTQLPHRALPFVAEHCVLLLDPEAIVPDMHAAYAALAAHRFGWGAFISGPSKTADIEQALVMGAQGPRTLLVLLDRRV